MFVWEGVASIEHTNTSNVVNSKANPPGALLQGRKDSLGTHADFPSQRVSTVL
jgi:hypothetical protein